VLQGALLVDKPSGPTSHDIVARVRRALGVSRIGHTGTLDPLATGLLVLLVGNVTRLAQFLAADRKEYLADIRLGIATDTYDAEGLEPSRRSAATTDLPALDSIAGALARFRGTFDQLPPPFSAKKIAGRRAYEAARDRKPVDLRPVQVTVHDLELVARTDDVVRLRVLCSAGFYVRSLAHDLGVALGCGAHLAGLRRTRAGVFTLEEATPLSTIEQEKAEAAARLVPSDALLGHLPALRLSEEGTRRAAHGNLVGPGHLTDGSANAAATDRLRLLDPAGRLVAVAERQVDGSLHPVVVLV
jgi:tRNA pseudouridine55 synthase